jgi:hypothetical protein
MKHAITVRRVVNIGSVLLLISLGGCGGGALSFEPEHASSIAGALYPSTSYDLKVGSSLLGNATVWSEGATGAATEHEQLLDVQMAIHNATNGPIRLDVEKSSVSVVTRDGRNAPLVAPFQIAGSRTAGPSGSTRVGLRYALPSGVVASDVARFDFNWRVASASGDYAQSTPFMRTPLPASDSVNDRGYICDGLYRVSNINECVNAPPTTSSGLPRR